MLAKLEMAFATLELQRTTLLDSLRPLTPEQLQLRVAPQEWSILEVVQHMVLAERTILAPIFDSGEPRVFRRSFRAKLAYQAVMFVLRWGITVKVPAASMVPDGVASFAELQQQWDDLRQHCRPFLGRVTPATVNHAIFRHPVCGAFPVNHALKMAFSHVRSHTKQIAAIRRTHGIE